MDFIEKNLGRVPPINNLHDHFDREGAWDMFLWFSELLADVLEELADPRPTKVQSLLASTLISDPTWPTAGQKHVELASKAFRSFLGLLRQTFRTQMRTLAESTVDGGSLIEEDGVLAMLVDAFENMQNEDDDPQLGEEFGKRIVWRKRSICFTKSKRLCLAPGGARPGDAITVLYGGPYLYVLRQINIERHFEIIGNAYMHGMMDGEAKQNNHEHGSDTFKIV